MQGDITHNFSGILEKYLWGSLFLILVKLQANKPHLCWKDIVLQSFLKYFVSTFSNFLGVAVFWRTLLNGYCQSYQKICVKEGNIFYFVFVFWGNLDWWLCNRFFKMFHIWLHHFNCFDCLETKIMAKAYTIRVNGFN